VAPKKVDACGYIESKYMANHPGELRGHEYNEKLLLVKRSSIHPFIHLSALVVVASFSTASK
jgi:hypothetical protein